MAIGSERRRGSRATAAAALLLLLLAGCSLPINAAPVVKLGVIAPFEGRGRALGYAVLPSIKEAAAEANASSDLGPYRVLVVAFNDNLDPTSAAEQAAALALDPDVFAVVGPFSADTAAAASPVLAQRGVPMAPVAANHFTGSAFSTEQQQAEEAARTLLQALAAQIRTTGHPARASASR